MAPPTAHCTVPVPFPLLLTVSAWGTRLKVAVTLPGKVMGPFTVQLLPEATQPLQVTAEPVEGAAVNVTEGD